MKNLPQDKAIVFFDGVCNLCNGFVQFIIKRDPHDHFRFAALSSEPGQSVLERYHIKDDSIVLMENGTVYTRSDAVLRIFRRLSGGYSLLYYGVFLPRPVRDFLYRMIANNRYRMLGKKDACWIPVPELTKKFLTD